MEVKLIKENEDGTASYSFDLTDEEAESLLRHGILEAIKAGIREGDLLKVEGEDVTKWVGLTKEEMDVIRNTWGLNTYRSIQDTENLLKGKNT